MRNVPKNWKVISRGFLRLVLQHGQKNFIAHGSGLKQDGWKWTSGTKIKIFYDEDTQIFRAQLFKPGHPTVTIQSSMFVDIVLDTVREEMKKIDRLYKEEE